MQEQRWHQMSWTGPVQTQTLPGPVLFFWKICKASRKTVSQMVSYPKTPLFIPKNNKLHRCQHAQFDRAEKQAWSRTMQLWCSRPVDMGDPVNCQTLWHVHLPQTCHEKRDPGIHDVKLTYMTRIPALINQTHLHTLPCVMTYLHNSNSNSYWICLDPDEHRTSK